MLLLLFLTFSALVANPKKLLYTVANPARGLLNRGKKKKKKVCQRPPLPRTLLVRREKKKKKITRRIHMTRRYASRRYAGGLGPSRVRTRVPTTRRLGQWVSLRKILRFRVRLQLSQLYFILKSIMNILLYSPDLYRKFYSIMSNISTLYPFDLTVCVQSYLLNAYGLLGKSDQ